MKLSIIIATYNRAKSLENCLKSVLKQSIADFELIIVDGGSNDGTDKVIENYSEKIKIKKLIYKEQELSKVRDFGWRNSKGEYLAWIDDDVVLSKDWAKNALKIFSENNKIGGISGPTIIPKELRVKRDVFKLEDDKSLIAKLWRSFFLERKDREIGKLVKCGAWTPGSNYEESLKLKKIIKVDYLEACNMILRRELVEKVDGYDFKFRNTSEWCELDLAKRVSNLGYSLVFSSKVNVEHHVSESGVFSNRINAKVRMENFLLFYFRHIFKLKFDYIVRFLPYLLFLNCYWVYKFIKSGNIKWLGGFGGTFSGIIKAI